MKTKIIEAIRNKYKNLGLGEKAIEAAAAYLEASLKEESEIETAVAGVEPILKAFQSDTDAIRTAKAAAEKRLAELDAKEKAAAEAAAKKAAEEEAANGSGSDLDAKLQAMFDAKVKPIQDELAAYKAKEATTARQNSITAKAKELGIPEERIKQGFVIAEDADDAAIGEYLSGIATYEKSRELPFGNHFPLQSNDKISTDEAKAIADKMIV